MIDILQEAMLEKMEKTSSWNAMSFPEVASAARQTESTSATSD